MSEDILTDQTIIIEKSSGTIHAIFPSGSQSIPSESIIHDLTGKTLISGLIEGHFHLSSTVGEITELGEKSMINMFQQGITSIRDMGGGMGLPSKN